MVVHAYNPGILESEAEKWRVRGHPGQNAHVTQTVLKSVSDPPGTIRGSLEVSVTQQDRDFYLFHMA